MERRAFLAVSGQTAMLAMAAGVAKSARLGQSEEPATLSTIEQRVAGVIEAYDAQGNHRTGTEVDRQSGEWLAAQLRQLGVKPVLEPFTLNRIDLRSCYLRVADRRLDGVPLFDARFTSAEGATGVFGPLGSDADIVLVESEPPRLANTDPVQRDQVEEARRGPYKAGVVLTRGAKPGLFLLNANRFSAPAGAPMLQISSLEAAWLHEQAAARADVTVVAHVDRTATQAFNVTAKIAGSNPMLAPLAVMAPRSGWWQCASEQGSRIACWLEVIRVVRLGKPVRDCFFVALSGHELGFLGMAPYLERHPDLHRRSHAWIFFGSDIGAPRQPNLIHASDEGLERWGVAAMEKEGIVVNAKARHDSIARGETRAVQRAGGRFFTVACASQVYHNSADRWPESIDVSNLARYARAFANGVLELARQTASA
jgi:Peptidase family M28